MLCLRCTHSGFWLGCRKQFPKDSGKISRFIVLIILKQTLNDTCVGPLTGRSLHTFACGSDAPLQREGVCLLHVTGEKIPQIPLCEWHGVINLLWDEGGLHEHERRPLPQASFILWSPSLSFFTGCWTCTAPLCYRCACPTLNIN